MKNEEQSTIYVRLIDEAVTVWRPVSAFEISDSVFIIAAQKIPEFEEWEFKPGDEVICSRTSKGYYRAQRLFKVNF